MKNLTIVKIGGNILDVNGKQTPIIAKRIKDINQRDGFGPVVVTSTFYIIHNGKLKSLTDVALDLGENTKKQISTKIETIFVPYLNYANNYMSEQDVQNFLNHDFNPAQKMVKNALDQVREMRRFSGYQKSMILAHTGEKLMDGALDFALKKFGINSWHMHIDENWIDSWPIVTDDNFERANFLLNESKKRTNIITEQLESGKVPVIGGFIGVTKDGLVTTFERGGTDRTAADIAILLSDSYDVTIDFEKFGPILNADPKIVDSPKEVKNLSYNEALIAGQYGTKILDPMAIRDIHDADLDMKLIVSDINNPNKFTTIRKHSDVDGVIKIVTGKKDCAVVSLNILERESFVSYLTKVRRYKEFTELSPDEQLGVARFLFPDGAYFKNQLEEDVKSFDSKMLNVKYGMGTVTLIGDQMGDAQDILATAFGALKGKNIWISDADAQSTTSRVLIVMKEQDVEKAVKEIHAAITI